VQGGRLTAKREVRVAALFKDAPAAMLEMIVVHELAHLKEREHNKPFYALCDHMLAGYHQIEFDTRLYLVLRPTLIWTRRPTPVEADRRLVSRSVLGGAGSWRKVRHERGAKAAKNGTMNNAAGVDVGGVCGQRWAGFRTAGRPAPSCWRSR
jgi:hypothetical protein